MDKKKIITILISLALVVIIICFFLFIIKKPVAKNTPKNGVAGSQAGEISQMLAVNQSALADTGVSGELPLISQKDNLDGDLGAKVKIIVYENLADNFSARFNDTISEIKKEFGSQIVFAFRPFFFKDDGLGLITAQAALCAADQNKFLEMRTEILAKVNAKKLMVSELSNYAKDLKLNVAKFDSCLQTEKYKNDILKAVESIRDSVVFGAPTIYVDSEVITGARAFKDVVNGNKEKVEGMESIINRHLK